MAVPWLRSSMWDLWWTKWHWDRFFSEYFGFPLSISFHRCSIKMQKQEKTSSSSSSSSQGCTISLQDCGAFVASAAGPFNKKKFRLFPFYDIYVYIFKYFSTVIQYIIKHASSTFLFKPCIRIPKAGIRRRVARLVLRHN